jgi:hypothetical protein
MAMPITDRVPKRRKRSWSVNGSCEDCFAVDLVPLATGASGSTEMAGSCCNALSPLIVPRIGKSDGHKLRVDLAGRPSRQEL